MVAIHLVIVKSREWLSVVPGFLSGMHLSMKGTNMEDETKPPQPVMSEYQGKPVLRSPPSTLPIRISPGTGSSSGGTGPGRS